MAPPTRIIVKQGATYPLFAKARRTDPETSHEAARNVEASGAAASQRQECLQTVQERPGSTAAEIAWYAGLERHVPSRRLPELRDAGLVENGEPRICRVTGNNSMTWWTVGKEST